jgi:hypothetical protein
MTADSTGTAYVYCRAPMNYVARDAIESTTREEVTIFDGRSAPLPGWQACGFERMRHTSALADWSDDGAIERVHYPEISAFAQALTGCDHVLVSSHIKRDPEQAARHRDLGPIEFVHSDFAASYGDVIRDFYRGGSAEAARALSRAGIAASIVTSARRLAIVQFWRNIGPTRMDRPIAFCDARTVPASELRALPVHDYAGGGGFFETLGVVAPGERSAHCWYAYPDLGPGEVVVFHTFDSELAARGEAFWTPHSAFPDPAVLPGKPSRRSIELRATCVFA